MPGNWPEMVLFWIFKRWSKNEKVNISKNASYGLKFSDFFRMGKTNTQTKLELISKIFENYIALKFVYFYRYCFIKPLIFSYEFWYDK